MKCWLGCLKRILRTGEPVEDKRMLKEAGKWVEIWVIWHDRKKMCCSDCLWIRTAKKGDSHPLRTKSLKHVCLKYICISWWLLTAAAGSESGVGQNCNSGARMSIPTTGTEQRSSREKGEPSIQVTVVIFMGITRALGDKSSDVLKSLIFSLVNVGGFFLCFWGFESFSLTFSCKKRFFSLMVQWEVSGRKWERPKAEMFPTCTHDNRHCTLEKSNVTSTGNVAQDQEEGLPC